MVLHISEDIRYNRNYIVSSSEHPVNGTNIRWVLFLYLILKEMTIMARGAKKKIVTKEKMKRANGTGTVRKLSGNRRKPYAAYITASTQFDIEKMKNIQKQKLLGTFETYELAESALNEYFSNPYDIEHSNITFEYVYQEWSKRYYPTLSNDSSKRTCISAFNHSKPLHNLIFSKITIVMMKDTIDKATCGNVTKGRMKSLYNLMYDFAVEAQFVPINLARQFTIKNLTDKIIKERKEKVPLSAEHEQLLWENLNCGYARMILIGIYTGFRPDELCTLERANVHLDENYIIHGMKTDAGINRYVPIHPKIKQLVEYYYKESDNRICLFIAKDGQGDDTMTYDKYRGRFRKTLSQLGIDSTLYSPHCTRHTFITKAKDAGMNEYALKKICGHEIYDVTESIYTHRSNEWLHEQIQLIK